MDCLKYILLGILLSRIKRVKINKTHLTQHKSYKTSLRKPITIYELTTNPNSADKDFEATK